MISRGRAWLGIGAGWFEDEHAAYGFKFPTLKERFERLEEALDVHQRADDVRRQVELAGRTLGSVFAGP